MYSNKVIVSCPYDSTHNVEQSKLPFHLMRCRRNQLNLKKVLCPYNAWHIIDAVEYEAHVACCPSSGSVKMSEYKYDPLCELGTVPLKTTTNLPIVKMKDWKEENVSSYDPWKVTEHRHVIRCLMGATKSQRKKFREEEQKRWSKLACSTNLRKQLKSLHITKPQKVPSKVVNLAQLVKNLENLHLQDINSLVESINLDKLVISKINLVKTKVNADRSKMIEKVLATELKKLVIQCLKN